MNSILNYNGNTSNNSNDKKNSNVKNNINNSSIQSNKPLPEVFAELNATRKKQFLEEKINSNKWSFKELREDGYEYIKRHNKFRKLGEKGRISNPKTLDNIRLYLKTKSPAKIISSLVVVIAAIFIMVIMYSNYIYANDIVFESDRRIVGTYEKNNSALNIDNIIQENSSIIRKKELHTDVAALEYEKVYYDNPKLPEGEEVVLEEGIYGKENVTYLYSYENDTMVEAREVKREIVEEAKPEYLDRGTSKYLAKQNAHIGDTLYLTKDVAIRFDKDESQDSGFLIGKYMDVKLIDLDETWCQVEFENDELILNGFIKSAYLVSANYDPDMPERNRIYKVLYDVNIDMPLNRVSGLTEADFVKVFTGNNSDKNKIFEENAKVFYEIEQKYNVNGIFLAAIGIHESAWGTSKIAVDKKNLFGYGAYDRSPYESAYDFETYGEGIEILAKSMAKYYLNEEGVPVYDDEIATGKYYNGPTLAGINVRYASDSSWHEKVFKTMETLYNKLK